MAGGGGRDSITHVFIFRYQEPGVGGEYEALERVWDSQHQLYYGGHAASLTGATAACIKSQAVLGLVLACQFRRLLSRASPGLT